MRDFSELIARLKQSDDNCNAECCECSGECLSSGCNIFSEAADAIEELLAAVPKWISVKERLPELGQGVLVYDDCEYMSVADYTHDKHFPTVYEFHVNGEYEPGVTHWMPLPEPPKEETE